MRLVIIGCGKSKIWGNNSDGVLSPQKAKDIYTSHNAKLKKLLAEREGCDWMMLSAKYGFIPPISPSPAPMM
jgi:hypothetical protein